jgi:hypothetical protein
VSDQDFDSLQLLAENARLAMNCARLCIVLHAIPLSPQIITSSHCDRWHRRPQQRSTAGRRELANQINRSGGRYRYSSYKGFGAAVLRFLHDWERRKSLGDRTRQYVLNNFGFDRIRKARVGIRMEHLTKSAGKR